MSKLRLILIAILILVAGLGLGYYFAPDKIEIKEKVVYRTDVEKEETKTVTEKFDPNTGEVVERVTETGKKERTIDTIEQEKEEKREKTKKTYALKLGAATPLNGDIGRTIIPRVGGEVRLPFFNSWAGLEADVDIKRPSVGAYIRLEF